MLRVLLLCLALLPSLVNGEIWSGFVYENRDLAGYTRVTEQPGWVYGKFQIYADPRFNFIDLDERSKNIYSGTWRSIWSPRDAASVTARWIEWGGWQYWFYAIENKNYFAILGSHQ